MSTQTTVAPGGGTQSKHPKGLYVLFLTEMWERFSFYLLIGLLNLYLRDSQTGGLGWSGPAAASLVGTYIGLVYFTPFLGGLIADRFLGYRKAIWLGGFFFILGHSLMAIPSETMLFVALGCLIIGNGLFKPNISTMVGRLYPANSPLRDNAYTIFYMGINIGAFACNFVAAIVRNAWGWHAAFATAGIGMAIGMVIFGLGQKHIRDADITDEERKGQQHESLRPLWMQCLGPAALFGFIGWMLATNGIQPLVKLGAPTAAFVCACLPVIWFFVRLWRNVSDETERGKVGALLAVFGVVVVFWMVFHQNSTALTEWTNTNTDRRPAHVVESVVGLAPDFGESAPPEYFYNASPDTARPADSMFRIVSDTEYEQLKKDKKLSVEPGQPTIVTQGIYDKVMKNTDASTPRLEHGKQLTLVNPELFASINAGFVIMFAPLLVALWTFLARRKKEPSTPTKIGLGLFLTGLSVLVMVGAAQAAGPESAKVSAWWLFGTYAVITLGELCLSPMGLSLVSKHAPKRIAGFMMGGWFLSTSIGNKMSGVFGELYHEMDHTTFFIVNAVCVFIAASAIIVLLPYLKRHLTEPRRD
jgi:POT family proton-dependent oligopeptide transporter